MIEDSELRALYKMESEDHLQQLDAGLLRLERNAQDSATLEEVFRAAHSLKGNAHMLGLKHVEAIAHRFEDTLGGAKRGRVVLSSETIDRLYVGLDAIGKLVQEAITGVSADVTVGAVLAQMSGAEPVAAVRPTLNGTSRADGDGETTGAAAGTVDAEQDPPSPDIEADAVAILAAHIPFKIDTIRVQPEKMDALMTLAAEMTVTTTRVARGLGTYQEISDLRADWNNDVSANGPACETAESESPLDAAARMAEFFEREQARIELLDSLLDRLKRTVREDVPRLSFAATEVEDSIRKIRLLPLSTVFDLFPRLVRDLAREQSKEVELTFDGETTMADKRILEELKDPLMHIIRNAVDHGIEPPAERESHGKPRVANLRLRAYQTATSVVVEIEDDGRGLDEEAIKRIALKRHVASEEQLAAMTRDQLGMLIFAAGFSTSPLVTDVSGRGVGLDVVRSNIEGLRGLVQVESPPAGGCTFRLRMPLTLATTRVLLVQVAGRTYALPVEYLQGSRLVSPSSIFRIEGREAIQLGDQPISVARLAVLLELPAQEGSGEAPAKSGRAEKPLPCVLLALGEERLGLFVDALLDEQEVILQPLGTVLKRVRNVGGSTILGNGEVCMILNAHDLLKSARKMTASAEPADTPEALRRPVILLAEDSITTRTQEKRILESAGYEVVTAVDGLDAFNKLGTRAFDGVVSDVEMPNLDGLGLAAKIREDARYSEVPIILVTSLASDEDRRRGAEVGANAYLTKGGFDQDVLIETLRRLV